MSDAGWVEEEHRWPITYLIPSLTTLFATATACFGSQASSYFTMTSLSPLTPPLALISAIACSAPVNSWSPYCATGPDIAPTTAIFISSANAMLLNASAIHPASNALPFIFILRFLIVMVVAFVVMLLFSTLFWYWRHTKYKTLIFRHADRAFSAYSAKTYPIFMDLKREFLRWHNI